MERNKTPAKIHGNLRDFRIDNPSEPYTGPKAPAARQGSHNHSVPSLNSSSKASLSNNRTSESAQKLARPLAKIQSPDTLAPSPSSGSSLNTSLGAQQSVKLRAQPVSKMSSVPKKLTAPLAKEFTEPQRVPTTDDATKAPTQASSWSLTDASLPAADEENLWGHWAKEASLEIDLSRARGQTQMAALDDVEIERDPIHLQGKVELRSQGEVALQALQKSGVHETRADLNEVLDEKQRLATENLGHNPWIVDLALSERRAERLGVVDYGNGFQKHEILKIRTREFTSRLHAAFREQIELFNESRRSPSHAVQVYKVNNTAEDFMLFRNGVKLVVSGQQAGRILFAFNQHMGQLYQANQVPTVEILASWGPFEQLVWQYRGERVVIEDVVRYFLSDFIRQSFR